MRTITRTYKVYSYDELSEVAKENVKKSFLENQEICVAAQWEFLSDGDLFRDERENL